MSISHSPGKTSQKKNVSKRLSCLFNVIHKRKHIKSDERLFSLQGKFVITTNSFFFERIKKAKQWRKWISS